MPYVLAVGGPPVVAQAKTPVVAMLSRRPGRWVPLLVAALGIVVVVLSVILSPMAMEAASRTGLDWNRLSDVGQAFGGVSAVLSALAFCAIAASLLLQWRQLRMTTVIAARERHFDLVRLAVDDPSLMLISATNEFGTNARVVARSNLWVDHWQMLWELGLLSDVRLSAAAATLFVDPVLRRWWAVHGATWAFSDSRGDRRFVNLVTAGYEQALAGAEMPTADLPDVLPSGERGRTFSGVLVGSVAGGAVCVAVLLIARFRKHSRRTGDAVR